MPCIVALFSLFCEALVFTVLFWGVLLPMIVTRDFKTLKLVQTPSEGNKDKLLVLTGEKWTRFLKRVWIVKGIINTKVPLIYRIKYFCVWSNIFQIILSGLLNPLLYYSLLNPSTSDCLPTIVRVYSINVVPCMENCVYQNTF